MEETYKNLLQKIKMGPAPEKIAAYRRLIVGYTAEESVVTEVAKQLAIETSGIVYNQVRDLDLTGGPRLDWYLIRTERLQKCKKADERYAALSVDADYGVDTRTFLDGVLCNDKDQSVRRRALDVLLAKNKGSQDLSLLTLAQTFLENEEGLPPVEKSMVWHGMANLAQSPEQIAFFDDVLATASPEHAAHIGQVLSIMQATGVAYDQKILFLCQDAYDSVLQNDRGLVSDTDRVLYNIVAKFLDHRTFSAEFMSKIFVWAIGPMLAFAESSDSNGWSLLRSVRDMLGRSDAERPIATDLLYRLITDEDIFDRERGFAVPYYVRSCRALGMSEAGIADQLKPLQKEGDDPVSNTIRQVLNQDPDAAAKRELAKQKFVEQKHRIEVVKTFADFVSPFVPARSLGSITEPVIAMAKAAEILDGATMLQAFADIGSQSNEHTPILTLDRDDRASASEVLEASQYFLALPAEDGLYADEAMYDASVHDQFALYAMYLARFDLTLAYVDVGWDDPCAVVLSQPDRFMDFLAKELPDITCTVFG
ncbi:hypothetical protein [Parasulfitobacter algicola]|uniref:HEAT repeat domain-containing protein n=1 Tax=Parasulfitobacter algicola TaxID=2614809 RepID=A0ABX2ISR3_9RHOB|nr:hypothetical protein [Sulfitobacter algicola]NSX55953.1 hypothetical protein [Sulfitobacter algicola]